MRTVTSAVLFLGSVLTPAGSGTWTRWVTSPVAPSTPTGGSVIESSPAIVPAGPETSMKSGLMITAVIR